jgi:hypothetical protein
MAVMTISMTNTQFDQQRAAMQMALEALESWKEWDAWNKADAFDKDDDKAITALREALAQPQEPSPAFQIAQLHDVVTNLKNDIEFFEWKAAQPQGEPVAWTNYNGAVNNRLKNPAPVDAKAIREERDSMWLAQMEFEQKRVRAEVEAEWIETNKALAKEIIEQRNRYLDMLAEAVDLSVKAEREACAKVCDVIGADMSHPYVANNCAAAIRGLK